MRVVMFCHSLVSDWNHGNAHFLRGVVARAARARPRGRASTSRATAGAVANLCASTATAALDAFRAAYPGAASRSATTPATLDLDAALDGADLVLVHEWNDPELVARASARTARRSGRYRAAVPRHAPPLRHRPRGDGRATTSRDYDGVLAFGDVIRDLYLRARLGRSARGPGTRPPTPASSAPLRRREPRGRSRLDRQLGRRRAHRRAARVPARAGARARPARARATACAIPSDAPRALRRRRHRATAAGCRTIDVPAVFARYRVTVHVPRRPYVEALPGIPTIRAVRGARLRHPAGLRAVGRRRGPVHAGRGLPRRARRRAR